MSEELDRDKPLFNDAVFVQVKFPDHDKTVQLTVRVLQGTRLANPVGSGGGGGQREGVLHLEITDELDPFFLFTLQVWWNRFIDFRALTGCLVVSIRFWG